MRIRYTLGDWCANFSNTDVFTKNIEIRDLKVENLQEIYPKASKYSNEDDKFKNKVAENLAKLNKLDSDLYNDWSLVSQLTIQDIKKFCLSLTINLICFMEKHSCRLDTKNDSDLKNNNLVILDDGALISSEKTEPPVLILKSDGTYLYMTTDLATVLNREERISPDNYLYIVDNRQSEHFKQLFSSVKYFNFSKSNFVI